MPGKVVVLGSSNLDIFVDSPQFPTSAVLSGTYSLSCGGKGANQACSASNQATTWLVSAHSGDFRGKVAEANLKTRNVNCDFFVDVSKYPGNNPEGKASGVAMVLWNHGGEDTHVVSKSTNDCVLPWIVQMASDVIASADVLLCNMTVPINTILEAARVTKGIVMLNPSPFHHLPMELINRLDVLVLNEPEYHQVMGDAIRNGRGTCENISATPPPVGDELKLARYYMNQFLSLKIMCRVVLTLGARGALFWTPAKGTEAAVVGFEPAVKLESTSVVDTTGAGDVVAGTLAGCLAKGFDLGHAVRLAVATAARVVTKVGAHVDLSEIEDGSREPVSRDRAN